MWIRSGVNLLQCCLQSTCVNGASLPPAIRTSLPFKIHPHATISNFCFVLFLLVLAPERQFVYNNQFRVETMSIVSFYSFIAINNQASRCLCLIFCRSSSSFRHLVRCVKPLLVLFSSRECSFSRRYSHRGHNAAKIHRPHMLCCSACNTSVTIW